jgi:cytochrome P450
MVEPPTIACTSPPHGLKSRLTHQNKGPVVRFGPNSLSFNSASALRQIYTFRSPVLKSHFYDAFVHPAPNTHNTRDREQHARKRRVLSHGFSDAAMKEMERYVLANVRTFCQQLGAGQAEERKGWTEPRKMSDWCNFLAMDILGDLCFGKAFRMLESAENRYALDLVAAATKRHLIVGCW